MSKSSLNTNIGTAVLTGGRRTTAAAVRSLLTDMVGQSYNMEDPAAGAIEGTELFPIIQDGVSKQIDITTLKVYFAGGGGSQNLSTTLGLGNFTGGQSIVSDDDLSILNVIDGEASLTFNDGTNIGYFFADNTGASMYGSNGVDFGNLIIGSSQAVFSHTQKINMDAPVVNINQGVLSSPDASTTIQILNTGYAAIQTSHSGNLSQLIQQDANAQLTWTNGAHAGSLYIQATDTTLQHSDKIIFDSPAYNFATATASRIASFDASKNLISLTTATYPSLTELSYVKGVTSSIQTQLNTITGAGYLTTISGIAAGGDLSGTYANPGVLNSAVIGKVLTGLNVTGSTISSADSILSAFGKLQNQINGVLGGAIYQGTWNASTNTPTLANGTGTRGYYYVTSVAGSVNFGAGSIAFRVGDWAIYDGSIWARVDNSDAVSSVNGYIGTVSLVTSDISESGNLYFTNARGIGAVLTGYTSGAGVVSATDTILQAVQKLNGNIGALVTGVSSVSGTANRITTSATTGALTVDISSAYVGQTTITTLGTVATGVWSGTAIADNKLAVSYLKADGSRPLTADWTVGAFNFVSDTTTGIKIGTATNQKIGFYNSTPIIQPTGDVITALQNLGLIASATITATTNANLTGVVTSVGNATSLGSFSSANLAAALTDETGTGVAAFSDSPVFTTQIITPIIAGSSSSAGTLLVESTTNATKGVTTYNASQHLLQTSGVTRLNITGASITQTQAALSGTTGIAWTLTAGAHTSISTSTENKDVFYNIGRTVQWLTGTSLALQRFVHIAQPTISATGASTFTDVFNFYVEAGAAQGTNATITRAWSAGFNGRVGIATNLYIGGLTTAATALIHLAAGTATANTAPLQFTAGTNETAARAGTVEYDGTNFYSTPNTTVGRWPISSNSVQYSAPTTGSTVVSTSQIAQLVCNPAGTLVALTITFPASPVNGQTFGIAISQIITTLTLNTSDGSSIDGTITTSSVNSNGGWVYIASVTTWFKTH